MELPDIDDERMKAASEALDKVIKAGGTADEARAEFERVIKGGAERLVDQPVSDFGDPATEPAKPARKPRSDKGAKRKPPTNKPVAETAPKDSDPRNDATKIGAMVIDLFAALKGAMQ